MWAASTTTERGLREEYILPGTRAPANNTLARRLTPTPYYERREYGSQLKSSGAGPLSSGGCALPTASFI